MSFFFLVPALLAFWDFYSASSALTASGVLREPSVKESTMTQLMLLYLYCAPWDYGAGVLVKIS